MLLLNARAVAALALAGSALAGATLTPTADAAFPGIDGRFAYSQPMGGSQFALHVVNPDGTEPLRLTQHEGNDFSPNWSPDSEKIVYTHQLDGERTVRVFTWDTQEDVAVVPDASEASWHPDGRHIVYVADNDVWKRSADPDSAEPPVNLTNSPEISEDHPQVKPDGTMLAFSEVRGGDGDITVLDLGTGLADTVTSNTLDENRPQWHPTEPKLTFTREVFENQVEQHEIFAITLGQAQATRLTNDPQVDYDPVYAPSGTKIAWRSQRAVGSASFARIWTMTPAGAEQAPVSASVNAFSPHWGSNLDPVPKDTDGDSVKDQFDNCPDIPNPGQENTYGDGRGDACEDKPVEQKPDPKPETREETSAPAPVAPGPVAVDPVQVPRAQTAVKSVTVKRCVSRRRFTIRLRAPRGRKIRSASVTVGGKRSAVRLAGRRHRADVDLRNLPKGRFAVQILVKTSDGKTVRSVRRYRTCAAKRG